MTPPRSLLVRLRGISKSYRRGTETVAALVDVSLEIRSAELVAIAGPSGSGKTTLLNVLCDWERPDDGTVWRRDGPAPTWQQLSVVPQRLGLLEELTVRENVQLPCDLLIGADRRRPHHHDVEAMLALLDLGELAARRPAEVSQGEQQRTAVARALVGRPALTVLDEPTGHQDEEHADLVLAALDRARAGGTAAVLATHDPRILARVDRVWPLADGRLGAAVSPSRAAAP